MAVRIVTYANVASTLALVVALSGGAYAAGLVGTSQLKNGAVTTHKLATRAVTSGKLKGGSVVGGKLATGAVTSGKLAPGAVGSTAIGDGAVGPTDLSQAVHDEIAAGTPLLAHVADETIQQIGTTQTTIATLTFPTPGTYLVVGTIRAFSRAANPGHNLNCSIPGGPGFTNADVPSTTSVEYIPMSGLYTATTAGQQATASCRQIFGSGEVTVSYEFSSVRTTG
jgi:hypothetical protein